MGVTIHYRGKLDHISDESVLRNELAEFARRLGWEAQMLDEDWSEPSDAQLVHEVGKANIEGHLGLKGISIQPHEHCETAEFFFDSEGNLTSIMGTILMLEGKIEAGKQYNSVKTQFAPIETHITLIELLRYLKKRYISNLEVTDEGEYWETGERKVLEQKIGFLEKAMDKFESRLEVEFMDEEEKKNGEEITDRIKRIFREIHKEMQENKDDQ